MARRKLDRRRKTILLPATIRARSADAAKEFVFDHAWGWDDSAAVVRKIPAHPYLEDIIDEWWATMETGQPLVIEKSRRLVVSWLLCALDVWDGITRQCNMVQGGIDYDKASEFVWRCYFVYQSAKNGVDGQPGTLPMLPPLVKWGNPLAQRLDKLAFLNGTLIEPLNSDGESFRGSGYTRVKLEELSAYRYPSQVWSQAMAVTMGVPGQKRGHIVAPCNARAHPEWQEIKARMQV